MNKDTQLFLSFSAMPSNNGMTIYNQLFNDLAINAVYISRKVIIPEDGITCIKTLSVKGCSISMPLKQRIIPYLDELDPAAKQVESVNTILVSDSHRTKGYNTDLAGVLTILSSLKLTSVIIYGTGAMATICCYVAKHLNIDAVYLTGRNADKINHLTQKWHLSAYDGQSVDLCINTTPASLSDCPPELIQIANHSKTIFDMVANKNTALSTFAKKANKPFISGFELYKYQFCEQFKLYTGQVISPDKIEKIAKDNHLI